MSGAALLVSPCEPNVISSQGLAPFIGHNLDLDESRSFSDTLSTRGRVGNRMQRILHRARLWFMSNRPDSIITTKRKMSDAVVAQGSVRSNSQRSGSSRAHRFTRMAENLSPQQSPPHEQISAPTDGGIRSPSTVPSVRGRIPSSAGEDGIFISSEKAPSLVVIVPERNATPGPLPMGSDQARARPRPRAGGGLGFDPLTRLSAVRVIHTRFIQSSRTIFKRVLRDEVRAHEQYDVLFHTDETCSSCCRLPRSLLCSYYQHSPLSSEPGQGDKLLDGL